jgi:hypothetical protein
MWPTPADLRNDPGNFFYRACADIDVGSPQLGRQ